MKTRLPKFPRTKPHPLTAEREAELAVAARDGNRDALGELLWHHRGWFMRWAIRGGHGDPEARDDLFQIINIRAMKALRTFDPSRGIRFLTYLNRGIRQDISYYRQAASSALKVPNPDNLKAIKPKLVEMSKAAQQSRSLEAPIGRDDDRRFGSTVAQRREPNPVGTAEHNDDLVRMHTAMSHLPEQSSMVLTKRSEGQTLEEISVVVGLSRERIRQIERAAVRKLRQIMGVAVPARRDHYQRLLA